MAPIRPAGSVLEITVPSLSVKDVPEPLAEKLRQRAARNHRSLQGELMAILEAAVSGASAAQASPESERTAPSFAEVADRFRRRFPDPLPDPLGAAAIIREMRDTHYGEAWVMAGIKDGHWPPQPGDSGPIHGLGISGRTMPDDGAP